MENKYDSLYIFTTDTVCGIGGPICKQTLDLLYEIKKRPNDKKIMILVGSLEQAQLFDQWNEQATKTAKQYWPGAYSIIVNNQGFRMPNNKLLCDFLLKNGPMYVTSANISGQKPININQASIIFPLIKNVYDFGIPSGIPSSLINLDTNEITIR
ncbi:Sua5/YciO/YrdC/YwlC family protein [Mycoplasmopsis cricetuli]|uniref:Sua5/YciO/YrdC/YwlC family protein n=1 Tax=Mycoplasmopsis cricetuli TaxID=171283 RepID=UPI00046E9B77|nr:Sua5/YciO/YrdC/YwlC family protein [Mycoplasmopsis cricetuli]